MTSKRDDEIRPMKVFTVAYCRDIELNTGSRDVSFTCAITVTLTSPSKAV